MEKIVKRVKMGIWVAIVAFIAILIYQNQPFFWAGQSLRLNLLFTEIQSPEWKILLICTGFFVGGLILGLYILVIYQLRSKRKRKVSQAKVEKTEERISVSEQTPKPAPPAVQGSDTETVVISPEVTSPVAERQES